MKQGQTIVNKRRPNVRRLVLYVNGDGTLDTVRVDRSGPRTYRFCIITRVYEWRPIALGNTS